MTRCSNPKWGTGLKRAHIMLERKTKKRRFFFCSETCVNNTLDCEKGEKVREANSGNVFKQSVNQLTKVLQDRRRDETGNEGKSTKISYIRHFLELVWLWLGLFIVGAGIKGVEIAV